MSGMMDQWIINRLMSAVWGYLAANWGTLAVYLIVAAVICAAVRKLLALYGNLPLIAGVVLLIVGAWVVGYRSSPVKTIVKTLVQTDVQTVEKIVTDDAGMARLRKQMAELSAQKDAALARAEAALAKLRQELDAANAEIQRLLAELAAKPTVQTYAAEGNGQCQKCRALFNVGTLLLEHKESIRCPKCRVIQSARSAVNFRNYVLSRQR